MVCDYWTWTSSAHTERNRFQEQIPISSVGSGPGLYPDEPGSVHAPADACPEGLALIYPPTGDELTEATTWMSGVHGAATNVSRAESERAATLSA